MKTLITTLFLFCFTHSFLVFGQNNKAITLSKEQSKRLIELINSPKNLETERKELDKRIKQLDSLRTEIKRLEKQTKRKRFLIWIY